jgi:RNA polymerase sigma factor (sigma-70 family)
VPDGGGAGGRVRDEDATDERELVARAVTDPDAFAALYRRYVDLIYRFAYRRSGSKEVAEDVTSATFEKALRGLDRFEWRPGGMRPWLYRIAANEVTDHHRRASRDSSPAGQRAMQLLGSDASADAEPPLADVPVERLRAALQAVNPRYQEALSLRYLAGLSSEETAAALGCSRATLAVVLHRAARALRRQLDAGGGTPR